MVESRPNYSHPNPKPDSESENADQNPPQPFHLPRFGLSGGRRHRNTIGCYAEPIVARKLILPRVFGHRVITVRPSHNQRRMCDFLVVVGEPRLSGDGFPGSRYSALAAAVGEDAHGHEVELDTFGADLPVVVLAPVSMLQHLGSWRSGRTYIAPPNTRTMLLCAGKPQALLGFNKVSAANAVQEAQEHGCGGHAAGGEHEVLSAGKRAGARNWDADRHFRVGWVGSDVVGVQSLEKDKKVLDYSQSVSQRGKELGCLR